MELAEPVMLLIQSVPFSGQACLISAEQQPIMIGDDPIFRFSSSMITDSYLKRISITLGILTAVLCAGLFSSPSSAEETKVSVQMSGIGALSCKNWRSTPARRSEGTIWIYGFWSGLNYVAAASEQAQSDVTGTAMVNEVDRICTQQPSEVLASAAWTAYLNLAKK